MVMCREPEILAPLKGCLGPNLGASTRRDAAVRRGWQLATHARRRLGAQPPEGGSALGLCVWRGGQGGMRRIHCWTPVFPRIHAGYA